MQFFIKAKIFFEEKIRNSIQMRHVFPLILMKIYKR